MTSSQRVRHQLVVKTLGGRGNKLSSHWDWLYPLLLDEFQRLRRAGLKISVRLVADIAVVLIDDSTHEHFNKATRVKSKLLSEMSTPRRVQDFVERHNIVYRRLKGKKQVSDEKLRQINMYVTAHLGSLKRRFEDRTLDPDLQLNMDESHFVIDLDDGKTFAFAGAESVKYCSVTKRMRF